MTLSMVGVGTLPVGVSLGHNSLVGVEPGTHLPGGGGAWSALPGGGLGHSPWGGAWDTPAVGGWLGHSPWCRRLGTQRAESSGHCPILSAQLWKLRDLSWAARPWEPRVSYGSPALCPADTIPPPLPLLPPPPSSSSLESVLGGWVRLNSLSRLKTLPSANPHPKPAVSQPRGATFSSQHVSNISVQCISHCFVLDCPAVSLMKSCPISRPNSNVTTSKKSSWTPRSHHFPPINSFNKQAPE